MEKPGHFFRKPGQRLCRSPALALLGARFSRRSGSNRKRDSFPPVTPQNASGRPRISSRHCRPSIAFAGGFSRFTGHGGVSDRQDGELRC